MKFYTERLWTYSRIGIVNRLREWKFKRNSVKYSRYYNSNKNKLPLNFVEAYQSNQRFHDFHIPKITFLNNERDEMNLRTVSLAMNLSDGAAEYEVVFRNVHSIKLNLKDREDWICGRLEWGYSEFEFLDDGKFKLNILCDVTSEIEIIFDSIDIKTS